MARDWLKVTVHRFDFRTEPWKFSYPLWLTGAVMKKVQVVSWAMSGIAGAFVVGCSIFPSTLWANVLQTVLPPDRVPRDAFGVGVLLVGVGVTLLGATKAWITIKAPETTRYSNGNGSAVAVIALTQKVQELLDHQRQVLDEIKEQHGETRDLVKQIHNGTIQLLEKLTATILCHDNYVKEHVTERGQLIARALGEDLAPLVVGAVRSAFDLHEQRQIARMLTQQTTQPMPKVEK